MSNCMFYFEEGRCKILRIQDCNKCKFEKTEQQYIDGQKHADEILKCKGLRRCMRHYSDGTQYVSVEGVKKI